MNDKDRLTMRIEGQIAVAEEIGSDFITLTVSDGKKLLDILDERYKGLIPRKFKCPNCRRQFTSYFENGNREPLAEGSVVPVGEEGDQE